MEIDNSGLFKPKKPSPTKVEPSAIYYSSAVWAIGTLAFVIYLIVTSLGE